MENNWLKNLKEGDMVIISSGKSFIEDQIDYVERFTKTQIVLKKSTTKYKIISGTSIGTDSWNLSYLSQPTKETINMLKKKNLIFQLQKVKWEDLDLQLLKEILSKVKTN